MPAEEQSFEQSTTFLETRELRWSAMFSNILVAYDGSPTSRSALRQAYELAQAEAADVTVVTVAPTVAPLAAIAPVSVEGLRDELDRWARKQLDEARAAAPDGLTVRTV